jgi:hypothetical protein
MRIHNIQVGFKLLDSTENCLINPGVLETQFEEINFDYHNNNTVIYSSKNKGTSIGSNPMSDEIYPELQEVSINKIHEDNINFKSYQSNDVWNYN